MGMTIDDAIKKYKNNAEYERTHGNLQGCLEFQQLAGWLKDYKRLLEQEPTTKNDLGVDCVSRAEVLKLMQDNWHTHDGDWAMQESMDDIRALPSVTPQEPRWIPVSERLPKNRGFYLVSTTDCITIMEFINGWISQNIGLCNGYVKAWMPLPQPYKAESEVADGNNYI